MIKLHTSWLRAVELTGRRRLCVLKTFWTPKRRWNRCKTMTTYPVLSWKITHHVRLTKDFRCGTTVIFCANCGVSFKFFGQKSVPVMYPFKCTFFRYRRAEVARAVERKKQFFYNNGDQLAGRFETEKVAFRTRFNYARNGRTERTRARIYSRPSPRVPTCTIYPPVRLPARTLVEHAGSVRNGVLHVLRTSYDVCVFFFFRIIFLLFFCFFFLFWFFRHSQLKKYAKNARAVAVYGGSDNVCIQAEWKTKDSHSLESDNYRDCFVLMLPREYRGTYASGMPFAIWRGAWAETREEKKNTTLEYIP